MARTIIPLIIFVLLVALLYIGLNLNPREIPSPLIGKPAPAFSLPQLQNPEARFSQQDLRGRVSLVNAWASWCVSCRSEHHLLQELSRQGVPIYGINYKDERADALAYLQQLGNPYAMSGHDLNGRVGIDWGVVATPETFVVDKQGVIRHKVTGPITPDIWQKTLKPMIEKLNKETF